MHKSLWPHVLYGPPSKIPQRMTFYSNAVRASLVLTIVRPPPPPPNSARTCLGWLPNTSKGRTLLDSRAAESNPLMRQVNHRGALPCQHSSDAANSPSLQLPHAHAAGWGQEKRNSQWPHEADINSHDAEPAETQPRLLPVSVLLLNPCTRAQSISRSWGPRTRPAIT